MQGFSFAAASFIALSACATAQEKAQPAARIVASYTLPTPRLGELQKSITDDRGFTLGGAGSDLWHGPGDAEDEFWLVTDRGPNGEVEVGGEKRRTFHVPAFTPHVLHVRAKGDALEILSAKPLVGGSGMGVSGLPNCESRDETPYDASGQSALAFDSSGLDTEGLVRTKSGELWLAEEYGPSLVRVSPGGQVAERFLPADLGLECMGLTDYPAHIDSLPRIFTARKKNRGFESLALSRDEKRLYTLVQSPLCVPDKKTAEKSRNARLLEFDFAAKKATAEFVYVIEAVADFTADKDAQQDDMKLSGLVALDEKRWLVLERTDRVAKLVVVSSTDATNILGPRWDSPSTSPSLEATADLAAAGVKPLRRERVIDLAPLALPPKIEGVAVLGPKRVAVINDNDFDVGALDEKGQWTGAHTPTRLFVIELGEPLY